jgi:predicted RNA-binding protein with PUA-like domain
VAKEFFKDPTANDDAWVAVELKPFKKIKKPVTLEQVKNDKRLAAMALVRLGRLSVQPVTAHEWKVIMELGEML